jgi:ubiquinone/menaquinone biosynthesis C-methylase UbiE
MGSQPKPLLKNDYERMVPEFHKGTLIYAEHMLRYLCAQDYVEGKVVLDIASGSGYGTHILSKKSKKIFGVDVNEAAVAYANQHYSGKNISYLQGEATAIPLDNNSVDVVVTFETIEHIKDYESFLREIKRVLKPSGTVLVSTPNDLEFAEGNHFHLHQFKYEELLKLIGQYFAHTESYFQATWKYVALGSKAVFEEKELTKLPTLNYSPIDPKEYLYFYIVCSDVPIKQKIEPLAALGEHYSDRQLINGANILKNELEDKKKELEDKKQNLKQLQAYLEQANTQALKLQKERDDLTLQIRQITSSKTYRLVKKVARLKEMK